MNLEILAAYQPKCLVNAPIGEVHSGQNHLSGKATACSITQVTLFSCGYAEVAPRNAHGEVCKLSDGASRQL